MPDLTENLAAFIRTTLAASFPNEARHVGELVPAGVKSGYVWLRQSGESMTEDLCDSLEAVRFDVEIVCSSIVQCRAWTAAIKTALRTEPNWSAAWGGLAQFASVDDHDDDYDYRSPDDDVDIRNVGALAVTMHV